MLTLNNLASLIHRLYVQHFGQEQSEPSTKGRAGIAIENVITVLSAQGIAPDIEIIAGPVSSLDCDIAW